MSNESEATTVETLIEELEADVEDMEPLPTPSEADLGELCRTEGSIQFEGCSLLEGVDGEAIEEVSR
jgi:hypothetical protein